MRNRYLTDNNFDDVFRVLKESFENNFRPTKAVNISDFVFNSDSYIQKIIGNYFEIEREDGKEIYKINLAGYDKDDIEVYKTKNKLDLSVVVVKTKDSFDKEQRGNNSFKREFNINPNRTIETAELKNGLLKLVLVEHENEMEKIEIE